MTATLDPSRLALGSWHIFPRLSLDEGAALVRRALDLGIRLFDVGDYWDHELSNEIRFREIVERLGLRRDEYRIGIKVFTNSVKSRAELVKESLTRLGVDHADYTICSRPATHESLEEAVEAMHGLVAEGLTRELAVSLWTAEPLIEAMALMKARGLAAPRFVQLQYSVCRRSVVESPVYARLFAETGILLQAADTLEGGILAGHLHRERFDPGDREAGRWFADRNIPRDSGNIRPAIKAMVPKLEAAAKKLGVTPAQLALAFCLTHPALDTLLFGATKVAQIEENLGAVKLANDRPDDVRAVAGELLVEGAKPPPLFDVSAGIH